MKDLRLENGDISFDQHGALVFTHNNQQTMQAVYIRIGTRRGEWFFDISFGVRWLELMKKGVPDSDIVSELRRVILQNPQVRSAEIEIFRGRQDRKTKINVVATLLNGKTAETQVVI